MGDGENHGYIVEYVRVGKSVKVTAVDPVSLREVSMVSSPRVTRRQLAALAVRKLEYVLAREGKS